MNADRFVSVFTEAFVGFESLLKDKHVRLLAVVENALPRFSSRK